MSSSYIFFLEKLNKNIPFLGLCADADRSSMLIARDTIG
jgi:hypothetical protein